MSWLDAQRTTRQAKFSIWHHQLASRKEYFRTNINIWHDQRAIIEPPQGYHEYPYCNCEDASRRRFSRVRVQFQDTEYRTWIVFYLTLNPALYHISRLTS